MPADTTSPHSPTESVMFKRFQGNKLAKARKTRKSAGVLSLKKSGPKIICINFLAELYGVLKCDPAVSGKCNPTVSVKFDPVAVSQNAEGLLITLSDS